MIEERTFFEQVSYLKRNLFGNNCKNTECVPDETKPDLGKQEQEQQILEELKELCLSDYSLEDQLKRLLRNTVQGDVNIKKLTYHDMLVAYKYAKTNYELFCEQNAAIYTVLCNTYDDRIEDGNLYQAFQSVFRRHGVNVR